MPVYTDIFVAAKSIRAYHHKFEAAKVYAVLLVNILELFEFYGIRIAA